MLMKHTRVPIGPVETVRRRVKELRGRSGMTAADLAEQLSSRGVPWNRSIVANFEGGRRNTVSVVELLALGDVFNVAPVHLLVPVDAAADADYQVTPNSTATVEEVRRWICGEMPLGDGDVTQYHRETPRKPTGRLTIDTTTPEGVQAAWEMIQVLADAGLAKRVDKGGEGGESGEAAER